MTDIWRRRTAATIYNGPRFDMIEVIVAQHHRSAGEDAIILRQLPIDHPDAPAEEVWISIEALEAVLSAAKAAGTPKQLELPLT